MPNGSKSKNAAEQRQMGICFVGKEAANVSELDHLDHFSVSLFATTKKSEITGNLLPTNGASNNTKTSMYDNIDRDPVGTHLDDASNTMSCLSGVYFVSINLSELHAYNTSKMIAYIQSKGDGSKSKAVPTHWGREMVHHYGTNEIYLSWDDTPIFWMVLMMVYYGIHFLRKILKYFFMEKCEGNEFKEFMEQQECFGLIIWTVKKVVMNHWLSENVYFISICICNRKDANFREFFLRTYFIVMIK